MPHPNRRLLYWRITLLRLSEIVVRSAGAGLKLIDPAAGTMPAGHNGLKHDPETPVRNTGQWSIIFFKAYEISGERRFYDAGVRTISHLLTRDARPMGATFWHRKNPYKDACNGVLGTAFSTEALMVAHRATGDERYRSIAAEVFRLHPFDSSACIWKRVNVDGSYPRGRLYSFDLTFNHQLWLAMAGSMIDPEAETDVGTTVRSFLDGLLRTRSFSVSSVGRIIDEVFTTGNWGDRAITLVRLGHRSISRRQRRYMVQKETAYQTYSLFAFARIAENIPNHALWKSRKIGRALAFINTQRFVSLVSEKRDIYWWRPIGFEQAKIIQVFQNAFEQGVLRSPEEWVSMEIDYHFDVRTDLLNKNSVDRNNMSARMYEATFLSDVEITL